MLKIGTYETILVDKKPIILACSPCTTRTFKSYIFIPQQLYYRHAGTGIRRFLGMINQLGKFTPHLAAIRKPMRDLLSKKNDWACPHVQSFFLLRRSRIGFVISARCGVNFPNWLIIPRNRRIPLTSVGSGMSIIDLTLSWSGLNPDSLMVWPKNLTS